MKAGEMKSVKQFTSKKDIEEWVKNKKIELMKKDYPPSDYCSFIDWDKLQIIVIKKFKPKDLTLSEILNYKLNKHERFILINRKNNIVLLSTNHEYYLQKTLAEKKSRDIDIYNLYIFGKIPDELIKSLK